MRRYRAELLLALLLGLACAAAWAWFAPGERHWHGATATTGMTHIAIQEKQDGKAVDWAEQVTDAQYRA